MASPRNMDRRPSRTDMSDIGSPRGLRSMGSYTDVLSMSSKSVRATLPYAHPPPAYISDVEAEQLIFAEIERPVKVSESALRSVNGFLDQILYDILSRSHSTALPAVRSAVPVILKQRLGRSAVQAADEELQDYIEEEEMEQVLSTPPVLDPKSDFDIDLAWKLTRLRCMVYAKLGNMEEEDEEDYLEDESLANHLARVSDSARASATITPPSAIFLTTVLEFLAEQALCIAAQHATKRHMTSKGAGKDGPRNEMMHDGQHDILLDDIDMSGVGKEGPLIRLWRSWKGSVRSGGSVSSRPTTPSILSPSSPESPNHEWKFPSIPPFSTIKEERSPSLKPRSSPLPADMPLPTNDDDIEEIEVPSRAHLFASEAENADGRPTLGDRRPSSMLILPGKFPDPLTSTAPEDVSRPGYQRKRSHSVPEGSQAAATSRGHVEVNGYASHHDTTEPFEELQDKSGGTTTDQAQGSFSEESQTGSSTLSNTISATVATIAGAIGVEAARALGRGHSTPEKSTTAEPESGAAAGLDMNTAPSDSQNGVSNTPNHPASDSPVEGGSDPEDLALSSADERDGRNTTQTNPRDSGFGVAAADENDLPIQGQVQDTTLDHPTGVHDLVTSAAQDPADDRRGRTPQREYESSYTGAGEDLYRNDEELGTATIEVPRPNVPVVVSTTRGLDASETAEIPSSMNRNVDSPRFPQHLPTAQLVSGDEKPAEQVPDRVPRYATSSNLSQQPHSRTTSANDGRPTTAGSATARRQHIRLNTQTDELDRAQRSLDVLIDSDETLHYTLTPKSAREGIKPKVKSQTQELADFFRNTAPPGEESARPKSSRSAKDNLTGSRSNLQPTTKSHIPLVADSPPSLTVQQTSVSSPSRPKHRLGEPRDARMTRNNTRDLADYARSTGPENEMQLPKPLSTRPNTAQTEGSGAGAGAGASEGVGASDRASTTPGKPANRLKFQARDAQIPRTTESSDLIDFIREGPPRAPGDHRIDRRVAPFRSTMDSDDLNALAPPPELDANGRRSDGSNQESAVTVKSMQSSMNSRTGLLDSTNRTNERTTNGIRSAANAAPRQPIIPEADGMPTRTRRRVLDPYAIDYSDDEDEDMEDDFLPQQQQRRTDEESLVDFLRNTAPTPGMITQPILAAAPGSSSQPDTLNERSSNDKLKNFFEGSTSPRNGTMNRTTNGSAARAESPHLTQIGSKMDKYRPTQPTHAAHVERNRQKMRAEPRDATSAGGNDTADLAAYLKNSGPPPGMETPPQRLRTASKDQAGFLRFFQRKGSVGK